jgi:myo-inositol catabolism protein IolC
MEKSSSLKYNQYVNQLRNLSSVKNRKVAFDRRREKMGCLCQEKFGAMILNQAV